MECCVCLEPCEDKLNCTHPLHESCRMEMKKYGLHHCPLCRAYIRNYRAQYKSAPPPEGEFVLYSPEDCKFYMDKNRYLRVSDWYTRIPIRICGTDI